jgi:hypothetical protein
MLAVGAVALGVVGYFVVKQLTAQPNTSSPLDDVRNMGERLGAGVGTLLNAARGGAMGAVTPAAMTVDNNAVNQEQTQSGPTGSGRSTVVVRSGTVIRDTSYDRVVNSP